MWRKKIQKQKFRISTFNTNHCPVSQGCRSLINETIPSSFVVINKKSCFIFSRPGKERSRFLVFLQPRSHGLFLGQGKSLWERGCEIKSFFSLLLSFLMKSVKNYWKAFLLVSCVLYTKVERVVRFIRLEGVTHLCRCAWNENHNRAILSIILIQPLLHVFLFNTN